MEIFQVNVKLLTAQAVNFSIVFLVLYFFVFQPLSKVMQDRTIKIAKSLEDAKKIEERLVTTEEDCRQEITGAKKEAVKILEEAKKQGESNRQKIVDKAKEEIGQVINQEKAKMEAEKMETVREIKKEMGNLIVFSVEKILEEKMTDEKDEEFIKKIVRV